MQLTAENVELREDELKKLQLLYKDQENQVLLVLVLLLMLLRPHHPMQLLDQPHSLEDPIRLMSLLMAEVVLEAEVEIAQIVKLEVQVEVDLLI